MAFEWFDYETEALIDSICEEVEQDEEIAKILESIEIE